MNKDSSPKWIYYELWVGYFEKGDNFKWKKIKQDQNYDKLYAYFKKFSKRQFDYSDKEFIEAWGTARLDIKLTYDNHILDWVGITSNNTNKEIAKKKYERAVREKMKPEAIKQSEAGLSSKEEKEAQETEDSWDDSLVDSLPR